MTSSRSAILDSSRSVGETALVEGPSDVRPTRSLRRNFSWTVAGNAVYAGCQWLMVVALAKLGTPELVGQFALGLAVTAPVIMLFNLQLRGMLATDARREYRFADYLALRLATSAAALGVILGVGLAYGAAAVIVAIGLAKAVEAVSDIYYGLMQQHERLDHVARSLMLRGPVALGALAGGVVLTGSVFWGAMAMAGGWAVLLLAHDLPGAVPLTLPALPPGRRGGQRFSPLSPRGERGGGEGGAGESLWPRWRPRALARLAWVSLPLGVTMMLISVNANVPRYFVEYYLGEKELGIFAALSALMMIGNQVVTALGQSLSPRLARCHAAGDSRQFRRLLGGFLAIAAGLGVGGVVVALVAGRQVLDLLYGPAYGAHQDVFILLMAAAGFWHIASVLGYAATVRRKIRFQPLALLVVLAVSCASAILLVPGQQLRGAAVAVVLGGVAGVLSFAALFITPRNGG
ncbi:MAG TPA: hypothetical protein VNK04_08125 [Gemmataceae bacterium]|nr:hypothetical protein [Gemmataceae bacterium]